MTANDHPQPIRDYSITGEAAAIITRAPPRAEFFMEDSGPTHAGYPPDSYRRPPVFASPPCNFLALPLRLGIVSSTFPWQESKEAQKCGGGTI